MRSAGEVHPSDDVAGHWVHDLDVICGSVLPGRNVEQCPVRTARQLVHTGWECFVPKDGVPVHIQAIDQARVRSVVMRGERRLWGAARESGPSRPQGWWQYSGTSRRSRNRWSTLVDLKALWQTINQVSCTISLPRTEARQVSDGLKSPPGQGGGMFHIWHAGADCLRSAPPATVLGLDGPTFRRQGQGDGVV